MGKNILITRFSGLGDVAITVPIVRQLALGHNVTILTRESTIDLFAHIDNLTVLTGEHLRCEADMRNFAFEMTSKMDVVADLHNCFRSKMIVKHLGKPTASYNNYTPDTQINKYLDVFNRLEVAINLSDLKPEPKINSGFFNGQTDKIIGFAPQSIVPLKSLSVEDAILKVKALQKIGKVLLFGHKQERQLRSIAIETGAINMAGQLPFDSELGVISNLDVMVSVDSANGHIAANYGVPVITLWQGTDPTNGYRPFMQPKENSFYENDNVEQIINRICSFL